MTSGSITPAVAARGVRKSFGEHRVLAEVDDHLGGCGARLEADASGARPGNDVNTFGALTVDAVRALPAIQGVDADLR
jgi:hypothetical protein